jgi:hypothetical protein
MGSHRLQMVSLGVLWLAVVPAVVRADSPPSKSPPTVKDEKALAARIDELLAAGWSERKVKPSDPADDAEFLRRVWLDLAGRIPDQADVRDFLDDKSPDKRLRAVKRILGDPDVTDQNPSLYVNHMSAVWRNLLLPQGNNQQVQVFAGQIENWLRTRFRENTSYDKMVRDLLTVPVGFNPRARGGVVRQPFDPNGGNILAFYQANESKPENLGAATSRLFLGIKLECAQCHNHPFAKWSRKQFWEYASFFADVQPPQALRPGGRPTEQPSSRKLKIPGTDKEVEAHFLDGSEPNWDSESNARVALADWMTARDNPFFARAAANRLWAHFFGIGIIEPLEEPGPENPPSHPELLDELAFQFAAHHFDFKYLIRAITASKAYQLSSVKTDPSQDDTRAFGRMTLKGLTPEQFFDSLALATGYQDGNPAVNQRAVFFGGGGSPRAEFLTKFANSADKRTEFQTSILQALTLMNGRFIDDATNTTDRSNNTGFRDSHTLRAVMSVPWWTSAQRVETLYLKTLSRKPRPEELQRLATYVDNGGPSGDQQKALADVFWALLNSPEFIFNH